MDPVDCFCPINHSLFCRIHEECHIQSCCRTWAPHLCWSLSKESCWLSVPRTTPACSHWFLPAHILSDRTLNLPEQLHFGGEQIIHILLSHVLTAGSEDCKLRSCILKAGTFRGHGWCFHRGWCTGFLPLFRTRAFCGESCATLCVVLLLQTVLNTHTEKLPANRNDKKLCNQSKQSPDRPQQLLEGKVSSRTCELGRAKYVDGGWALVVFPAGLWRRLDWHLFGFPVDGCRSMFSRLCLQ